MIAWVAQAVSLLLLGICFLLFSAASYRHFRAGESWGNTAIRALTLGASAGFALLCLSGRTPDAGWSVLASGLALASLGIFRAALTAVPDRVLDVAFTGTGPEQLFRQGIYGRVRHPLYLSYLLYWAGWLAACAGAWPTVVGLGGFAALYWLAARQEEAYLSKRFSKEFRAHRQAAGLFWPILPRSRVGTDADTVGFCPK